MRSVLAAVVILYAAVANAQVKDISATLGPVIEKHQVPGIVAAMVRGEEVVAIGAAGVRKAGGAEKMTTKDRIHIGSCTKAMTATLCAMLVEEGKLKWDSTLGDVFPRLKPKMKEVWHGVTLEQLLTNTGGAPSGTMRPELWESFWKYRGAPTGARRLLLEGVTAADPEAAPGEKYIYSNAGFAMAGHMAEEVTKQSWENLLRQRLFVPLKMTSAGFGAPGVKGRVTEPWGHRESGEPVEPGPGGDNPVAIGPAGTVHCSITDWARFAAFHSQGAQGKGKLLKAETFRKLHTPVKDQYAMGWIVVGDGKVLTHAGSNTMWHAVVVVVPQRDAAIVVATNKGGDEAEKACQAVINELMKDVRKD